MIALGGIARSYSLIRSLAGMFNVPFSSSHSANVPIMLELLASVLLYVGPLVAIAWAVRAGRSGLVILLASIMGGIIGGLPLAALLLQVFGPFHPEDVNVRYPLLRIVGGSAFTGAWLGLIGLLARAVFSRKAA